jgi:NADH:ubiquinone oxidoreductase subunit 5 (subunit L)/multisubunit Na+/H+ antiporter MnhA subunit
MAHVVWLNYFFTCLYVIIAVLGLSYLAAYLSLFFQGEDEQSKEDKKRKSKYLIVAISCGLFLVLFVLSFFFSMSSTGTSEPIPLEKENARLK